MAKKNGKVTDPNISVYTKHLMPLTEEKWDNRKPSKTQKRKIATTLKSINNEMRKIEFEFGYTAYYMTIQNANESWVSNWCNPKNEEQALNGDDIGQAVSLVGNDGYEMGAGHKTNLIIGNAKLANRLLRVYNQQKKNIRFVAITDKSKSPSSSTTSDGYMPTNIYTVDFMTEKDIKLLSIGGDSSLEEFMP